MHRGSSLHSGRVALAALVIGIYACGGCSGQGSKDAQSASEALKIAESLPSDDERFLYLLEESRKFIDGNTT
jgi:hypothetical protein